jgi:hypothetical protein
MRDRADQWSYDSSMSPGLSASKHLRSTPAGIRVAITASIGVAVGAIVSAFTSWQAAILIGWDAAAMCLIVWIWLAVAKLSASESKSHASREDRASGCPNSSFFPRGSLCSRLLDWSSSELVRQSVEPRPT